MVEITLLDRENKCRPSILFYHYEECGEQAYTKSKGEPKYLLLARVKYIFSRAEMLKFGKLLIS